MIHSAADKKKMACSLYFVGERTADRKKELAELLSVALRTITEWVSDLDQQEREERKELITDMWLSCYTNEEIGDAVGLKERQANDEVSAIYEALRKTPKVTFSEENFTPPIYNIWSFY